MTRVVFSFVLAFASPMLVNDQYWHAALMLSYSLIYTSFSPLQSTQTGLLATATTAARKTATAVQISSHGAATTTPLILLTPPTLTTRIRSETRACAF